MLNVFIKREKWVRQHLQSHAGKTLRFAWKDSSIALDFAIKDGGYLESQYDLLKRPELTFSIAKKKDNLPSVSQGKMVYKLSELLHISGEAGLAQAISEIINNIHWDIEDELARVLGNIPSAYLAAVPQVFYGHVTSIFKNLAFNISEYITEEEELIVSKLLLQQYKYDLNNLNNQVNTLLEQINILRESLRHLKSFQKSC